MTLIRSSSLRVAYAWSPLEYLGPRGGSSPITHTQPPHHEEPRTELDGDPVGINGLWTAVAGACGHNKSASVESRWQPTGLRVGQSPSGPRCLCLELKTHDDGACGIGRRRFPEPTWGPDSMNVALCCDASGSYHAWMAVVSGAVNTHPLTY